MDNIMPLKMLKKLERKKELLTVSSYVFHVILYKIQQKLYFLVSKEGRKVLCSGSCPNKVWRSRKAMRSESQLYHQSPSNHLMLQKTEHTGAAPEVAEQV